MRKAIPLLVLTLTMTTAYAADSKYPCSEIPEGLKVASKAIIRLHEQRLLIKENGAIEHESVFAITIMDENGEDLDVFYGPYDKYSKLRSVTGRVYNADGKQEEVLRGEDVMDYSTIASYSLYEDNRIKIIDPEFHSYPYTVEYTVNYLLKSFLDIPDWMVYPDYNVAVEKASFQVTASSREEFRYLMRNMEMEPEVNESDEGVSLTWTLENLPALMEESLMVYIQDVSPGLFVGPNDFEYGGSQGNMTSWKEFGDWIYGLGEDKKALSKEETAKVSSIVTGLESDREKVDALYAYMQGKVRYVNIKLGIGGFEPIAAATVSEAGYGDCKALSNYLRSILEAVDIPSFYTLVRAGRSHPEFIGEFPSQQFNHAILAVPLTEDTIWLECTSQRLPAGYLGTFTDDRDVLFVSKEGGVLTRTPKFEPADNLEILMATCMLDENLGARISYSKSYRGYHFGEMQSMIYNRDSEEQKRAIQGGLRISGLTVEDFAFEEDLTGEPVITEKAEISASQMISPEGDFIPLELGVLSEELYMPGRSRNRKYPVVRKRGYSQLDSITFHLPANLEIQQLPEAISIQTDFGSYDQTVSSGGDQILYCRKLVINDGKFEAERFNDYYRFLRQVNSADRRKAMLVRK